MCAVHERASSMQTEAKKWKQVLIMTEINWVTFKAKSPCWHRSCVKKKRKNHWYLERSTVTRSEVNSRRTGSFWRDFRKSRSASRWGPFGPLHCFTTRFACSPSHLWGLAPAIHHLVYREQVPVNIQKMQHQGVPLPNRLSERGEFHSAFLQTAHS